MLWVTAGAAAILGGAAPASAAEVREVRVEVRVGESSCSELEQSGGAARQAQPEAIWKTAAPPGQLVDLPLEVTGGRAYVPVTVQGLGPVAFSFDTGSPETILDSGLARELGLPKGPTTRMTGAGEGSATAWLTYNVNIELDAVRAGRRATWTLPLDSEVGPAFGRRISGLIGNYMGHSHTVELDYPAGRLRLFDAARYEYRGEGTPVQVKYAGHTFVHAVVQIEGKPAIEGPFLMDSGAGLAVYITTPTVEKLDLRDSMTTVRGVCGHGLGGEITASCGRAQSLKLAGFTLDAPIVVLAEDQGGALASEDFRGIIGGEVLSRFKLVLDYSRDRVVFEAGPRLSEPFEFDMSGLWLEARDARRKEITVSSVRAGSAGDAAGLAPGDVIESADGTLSDDIDALRRIFREDGRTVVLKIKRGTKNVETTVRLRREI